VTYMRTCNAPKTAPKIAAILNGLTGKAKVEDAELDLDDVGEPPENVEVGDPVALETSPFRVREIAELLLDEVGTECEILELPMYAAVGVAAGEL